jgi:hypothetical protein
MLARVCSADRNFGLVLRGVSWENPPAMSSAIRDLQKATLERNKLPMKPANEQRGANALKMEQAARLIMERGAFQAKMAAVLKVIVPDLMAFLVSLSSEGERSAVVLGAERTNAALETLLRSFLNKPPTRRDNLFSTDGALATFSRKIEMAYRLGLIDLQFKRALDLVRALRNGFAHATRVESLQRHPHVDKVRELCAVVAKGNERYLEGYRLAFKGSGKQAQLYLSCVMLLLSRLELVRHDLRPPRILLPARVNYHEEDG